MRRPDLLAVLGTPSTQNRNQAFIAICAFDVVGGFETDEVALVVG